MNIVSWSRSVLLLCLFFSLPAPQATNSKGVNLITFSTAQWSVHSDDQNVESDADYFQWFLRNRLSSSRPHHVNLSLIQPQKVKIVSQCVSFIAILSENITIPDDIMGMKLSIMQQAVLSMGGGEKITSWWCWWWEKKNFQESDVESVETSLLSTQHRISTCAPLFHSSSLLMPHLGNWTGARHPKGGIRSTSTLTTLSNNLTLSCFVMLELLLDNTSWVHHSEVTTYVRTVKS